jgi:hypothetical protein
LNGTLLHGFFLLLQAGKTAGAFGTQCFLFSSENQRFIKISLLTFFEK